MIKRGITNIYGYDPKANKTVEIGLWNKIKYIGTVEETLKDSECAILISELD